MQDKNTMLIRKIMYAIAGMSKKVAVIYICLQSFFFLAALTMILGGLFLLEPSGDTQSTAVILLSIGFPLGILVLASVVITAYASNYVRKGK